MDLKNKLDEIMNGSLNQDERSLVEEKKSFFSSTEGVAHADQTLLHLQNTIGESSTWKKAATISRQELENISEATFLELLSRFAPFIKSLPAGHSRGHLLRTNINFTLFLYDPTTKYLPEEIVTGMIASFYHDIGRFATIHGDNRADKHAEIGAALFGEIAQGVLPENLMRMTQFAIATHTRIGKSNMNIDTNFTFDDVVEDGHKTSLWMTKFADRLDARGLYHSIRAILFKIREDSEFESNDGFAHKICTELSSFAQGDTESPPQYNLNMSEYILDKLFSPENLVQKEFLGIVRDDVHNVAKLSSDERIRVHKEGVEKFTLLARLLEPSYDLDERTILIEKVFSTITDNRLAWLLGFIQLNDKLYPEVFGRKEQVLRELPSLMLKEGEGSESARRITREYLYPIAKHSLEYFKQAPIAL